MIDLAFAQAEPASGGLFSFLPLVVILVLVYLVVAYVRNKK